MDASDAPFRVKSSQEIRAHFSDLGVRFCLELETFCDLALSVPPNEEETVSSWFEANQSRLNESGRTELSRLLHEAGEAMSRAFAHISSSATNKGDFEEVVLSSGNRGVDKMISDLFFRIAHSVIMNRQELTGRAFLIAAVSSFEILFGHIVRATYERNPSALEKSGHSFTLEELSQFASIADARAELVTRKVDSLLMESVDAWGKWLQRTMNFDFEAILDDWAHAREVFSRRNILVHADDKVSARYIQDLKSAGISVDGISVGQQLDLPGAYVQESLARLIALGTMLVYSTWTKLYKAEKVEAAKWLAGQQDQLVRREIWSAVSLISKSAKLSEVPREIILKLLSNGWLARKRMHGLENIEKEVEAWDISALSPFYSMVKSLLLDDLRSDDLVDMLVENGQLSWFEVASEPLFSEYRARHPEIEGDREVDAPDELEDIPQALDAILPSSRDSAESGEE